MRSRRPWRGSLAFMAFVPAWICVLGPYGNAFSKAPLRLSIVLVTSPIPSHPSTQLVDSVIDSFDLIDGLQSCPLIIVADGITIREGKPVWNQGKVNTSTFEKYLSYIDALRSKYENINMTRETRVLGPLEQRVNFAHALLRGLQEVESEYVLVVQHDRVFSEKFSMIQVLELYDRFPNLRYVGFQTVPDYTTYAASKYGSWLRCDHSTTLQRTLIPCFMWYDSTHICRTQQLAELIQREVRPGEFIESSYGCRLLAEIRQKTDVWTWEYHMNNYGVFFYLDEASRMHGRPLVRHVSGRSFLSREERLRRGWPAERPLIQRKVKEDLTEVFRRNLQDD